MPTAPAGRFSPSVHGRAPTYQPLCSLCLRWVARVARLRATARSLSQEEAQHARFRRALAAPRCLESAHTLWKPTAPAGRPSPSVQGRAPTRQPRPPNEQLTCVRAQVKQRKPRALSLSLRRERSTRASDVRAPRCAGWSRPMPYGSPLRQQHGRLPRCTAVFRRASRGLQTRSLLAYVRKSKSANRARSLDDHELNINPGTPCQQQAAVLLLVRYSSGGRAACCYSPGKPLVGSRHWCV